ncbi:MAG: hypothetical protein ABH840_01735 [Nanoarchaeota archaeon]
MRNLFSDQLGNREPDFSDFEKRVMLGNVDWKTFYFLSGGEREKAVDLLLRRDVLSVEREGNLSVVLADSCRQDLIFDYKGEQVYFTDSKIAEGYYSWLHSQGCLCILKRK